LFGFVWQCWSAADFCRSRRRQVQSGGHRSLLSWLVPYSLVFVVLLGGGLVLFSWGGRLGEDHEVMLNSLLIVSIPVFGTGISSSLREENKGYVLCVCLQVVWVVAMVSVARGG